MEAIYLVEQYLKNCMQAVLNGKKIMLKFNEDFIKNYDEDSNKGYILEVDVTYPKNLHGLHEDLPFLLERMKLVNARSLYAICMIKKLCCSYKVIKTRLKSWTNIKEGSKSNPNLSRIMA